MGAGYSMTAKGEEAEVFIYEDVGAGWLGGVSAKQFAADLKALGSVNTINLRINSYGGEVFDGVAIYTQLKNHPARVVAHIDGVAASIASVIAMAGDEIRMAEAGFLMIHNASGVVFGEAKDMRKVADLLDTVTATIADVYHARTGQDLDAIRSYMDDETWFTAAEAHELLFVDAIEENLRVAASGDPKAFWAGRDRPKPRAAADVARLANETQGLAPPVAPEQTDAPKPHPIAARVALQRAQLATHLAKRSAA
ncbi:head maturation protease, ClpP-related [Phenylobacterium sp.]|uniref:head maturation protease, ClpP-related n=1 Tax=Phenylobacterium sp. TaxID=1871053 RepID=UPI00301C240A